MRRRYEVVDVNTSMGQEKTKKPKEAGQAPFGASRRGKKVLFTRYQVPLSRPRLMYSFHNFFFFFFFFFAHFDLPASGQAVVTGVIPSPPRFLPSNFIAHRVQQSHCSSIVHRVLLTHALALSASQFVHKKKSQRIYTSMHSAWLELTTLGSRIT